MVNVIEASSPAISEPVFLTLLNYCDSLLRTLSLLLLYILINEGSKRQNRLNDLFIR